MSNAAAYENEVISGHVHGMGIPLDSYDMLLGGPFRESPKPHKQWFYLEDVKEFPTTNQESFAFGFPRYFACGNGPVRLVDGSPKVSVSTNSSD